MTEQELSEELEALNKVKGWYHNVYEDGLEANKEKVSDDFTFDSFLRGHMMILMLLTGTFVMELDDYQKHIAEAYHKQLKEQ